MLQTTTFPIERHQRITSYLLWNKQGRPFGGDGNHDWFEAERILSQPWLRKQGNEHADFAENPWKSGLAAFQALR